MIATALCTWYLGGARPYEGMMRYLRQRMAEMGGMGDSGGGETFCVGVDIGQSVDPTAICVMSRIDRPALSDVRDPSFKREVAA